MRCLLPSYCYLAAIILLQISYNEVVVAMNPFRTTAAASNIPEPVGTKLDTERSVDDTTNPISRQQDPPPTQHDARPVAIITGGTRGIGSGIATVLASQGYDLVLTYNTNEESANEFKDSLQQQYPSCQISCVGGDLTLTETRDGIFACLLSDFPDSHLQVLVHNAGQYLGMTSDNAEQLSANAVIFGDGSLLEESNDGVQHTNLSAVQYYQRLYGDAWIDLCERSIERMKDDNKVLRHNINLDPLQSLPEVHGVLAVESPLSWRARDTTLY